MKKNSLLYIKIAVGAAFLVVVGFALWFAKAKFVTPPYNANAPTSAKFAKASKWIPSSSEFYVSIDIQKAMQNPSIKEELSKVAGAKEGIVFEFIKALIEKQSSVGMLVFVGKMGDMGTEPDVAVIAQGDFDAKVFIPAIRTILAAGKAGLASEKLENRTIYFEGDVRDPFAFMPLDNEHIAVGNRVSIAALFTGPAQEVSQISALPESTIFGRLNFGPRLSAVLPQGFPPISGIDFSSEDGQIITAKISGTSVSDAKSVQLFLEGIRSLLMLQEESNPVIIDVLQNISVAGDEAGVTVTANISSLFKIAEPEKE